MKYGMKYLLKQNRDRPASLKVHGVLKKDEMDSTPGVRGFFYIARLVQGVFL